MSKTHQLFNEWRATHKDSLWAQVKSKNKRISESQSIASVGCSEVCEDIVNLGTGLPESNLKEGSQKVACQLCESSPAVAECESK